MQHWKHLVWTLLLVASPAWAATPLEQTWAQIAAESGGSVGVAAVHLESGAHASLHGADPYPLQSVVKLPLAIAFLRRVDRGELSLETKVTITEADLRPGYSPIADHFHPGLSFTTAELLQRVLQESDNTACDLLIKLVGGVSVVNAELHAAGVPEFQMERSELELNAEYSGISLAKLKPYSLGAFQKAGKAKTAKERSIAAQKFLADTRDSIAPDVMAKLLGILQSGMMLKADTQQRLMEWLVGVKTGQARIKGLLPPGTVVAHKTGSSGTTDGVTQATNDSGIVTLPDGRGHLALAIFVKGSTKSAEERERIIARIAKAAYDHWMEPSASTTATQRP